MRNSHLGMGATQNEIDEVYGYEPEYEVVARQNKAKVWDLVSTFQMRHEAEEHAEEFYAEHPDLAVAVQYENREGTYNRVYEAQGE